MSNYYPEADYENSVIELFRNDLGYDYIYAPDMKMYARLKTDNIIEK